MSLDARIVQALNAFVGRSTFGDALIFFVASRSAYLLGATGFLIIGTLPYSLNERIFMVILAIGTASAARFGIVTTLYCFYKRPRPHDALQLRPLFIQKVPSFPSGHAAFFFAFGTVLCWLAPLHGLLFLGGATIMCIGRIASGVHYPSDILGGAGVGITTALLGIGVVSFGGLL